MALLLGLGTPAIVVSLAESLPPQTCAPGRLGIIYALAIASFGGTAQFMVTWLIDADRLAAGAGLVHVRRRWCWALLAHADDARKRAGQEAKLRTR